MSSTQEPTTPSTEATPQAAEKMRTCPKCSGSGIWNNPRTGKDGGCFVCGGTDTMQGRGLITEARAIQWQKERLIRGQRIYNARTSQLTLQPYRPAAELPIAPKAGDEHQQAS